MDKDICLCQLFLTPNPVSPEYTGPIIQQFFICSLEGAQIISNYIYSNHSLNIVYRMRVYEHDTPLLVRPNNFYMFYSYNHNINWMEIGEDVEYLVPLICDIMFNDIVRKYNLDAEIIQSYLSDITINDIIALLKSTKIL